MTDGPRMRWMVEVLVLCTFVVRQTGLNDG